MLARRVEEKRGDLVAAGLFYQVEEILERASPRVYKDLCKRSPHLKGRTKWKSTEKFWTS